MKYTKSHEWVKNDGENAMVGISDHAQNELSDVVYVDFPKIGEQVTKGNVMLSIESVKAASEAYAPVSGEIIEVNQLLDSNPEKVNQSPENEGWLVKLKLSDPSQLDELLSKDEYMKMIAS